MLKIIAGVDIPDSGKIIYPKDYKISYSAQKPDLNPELTVLEQVFEGDAPVFQLLRQYEQALMELESSPNNQALQERVFDYQRKIDAMDAWDISTNAQSILTKLGITDINKKIGELSGGQKKRVALAQVLIQESDLLILDEPTNHLDYESVKWLEEYLARYKGALLLVTHDRYFLDRVTNRIFELDGEIYTVIKGIMLLF